MLREGNQNHQTVRLNQPNSQGGRPIQQTMDSGTSAGQGFQSVGEGWQDSGTGRNTVVLDLEGVGLQGTPYNQRSSYPRNYQPPQQAAIPYPHPQRNSGLQQYQNPSQNNQGNQPFEYQNFLQNVDPA